MKTKPPTGEQPILSLRIPPTLLTKLDELARKSHISRSTLVRMALNSGLRQVEKMVDVMEPPR
jgi:metal-responsive CopG/Arc/MetJ family transcriptional regulator